MASIVSQQQAFAFLDAPTQSSQRKDDTPFVNGDNSIRKDDKTIHNWYRFVLSYPPHLVRDYLTDFALDSESVVLDPFCGTGTTIVEAQLNGVPSIGIEANPFPHFASQTKVDWAVNPDKLSELCTEIAEATHRILLEQGIDDKSLHCVREPSLWRMDAQAERALIHDSISPLPLHKSLVLLAEINRHKGRVGYENALLALGNALVTNIGNLRFGPEVGVGKKKADVPVVAAWNHEVNKMIHDLRTVQGNSYPKASVLLGDARNIQQLLPPNSVDAVITSPPYPNEKDYTRTTRLESVILGFFPDMLELRHNKKRLLRSNTRGVYKLDTDDQWVADNSAIQKLANSIEDRRLELGKTSGFEKLYARVTRLYFGGMARHLSELRTVLKPGARLAYVVGDQASYLRILIRTGQLLAQIAQELGYEVERIDLFRTRFATATRSELREEVVVLRWPGQ